MEKLSDITVFQETVLQTIKDSVDAAKRSIDVYDDGDIVVSDLSKGVFISIGTDSLYCFLPSGPNMKRVSLEEAIKSLQK